MTGLETLILGLIFAITDNFMDRPPHSPEIISEVNKPIYSMILIFIGLFVVVVCNNELKGKLRLIVTFLLSFVWLFYSIIFLIHDLFAPVFVPHLDTILVCAVAIRITVEAMWGDTR
jgi:CHASE2 domain-containing sensor protein